MSDQTEKEEQEEEEQEEEEREEEEPEQEELTHFEGMLLKKRDFMSGWRPRYFVLQGPLLAYFISPQDKVARSSLFLQHAQIRAIKPISLEGSILYPFELRDDRFETTLLLAHSSEDGRDAWIRNLVKAKKEEMPTGGRSSSGNSMRLMVGNAEEGLSGMRSPRGTGSEDQEEEGEEEGQGEGGEKSGSLWGKLFGSSASKSLGSAVNSDMAKGLASSVGKDLGGHLVKGGIGNLPIDGNNALGKAVGKAVGKAMDEAVDKAVEDAFRQEGEEEGGSSGHVPSGNQARLDQLLALLQEEREERQRLAELVADLQTQVARLGEEVEELRSK